MNSVGMLHLGRKEIKQSLTSPLTLPNAQDNQLEMTKQSRKKQQNREGRRKKKES